MEHAYNGRFIQYAATSSSYAAHKIVEALSTTLNIRSVLDVGCAAGTWLRNWSQIAGAEIFGIDGYYIRESALEIPASAFRSVDLNQPYALNRTFELVQSLEVAEHIEPQSSDIFIDCIAQHSERYVLFSAAPPGQGGEFHVNEQPYDFWRVKFSERGFIAVDAVRPLISNYKRISYWYRYNTLLYVRAEYLSELPIKLRSFVIPEHAIIPDVSPLLFRARKALVRRLPRAAQEGVAHLKARFLPSGRI